MLSFLLRLLFSSILVVVYVNADMFAYTEKFLTFSLSLAFAGNQDFCFLLLSSLA